MGNIFGEIARMRTGMKMIGCSQKEIEDATKDVQDSDDYDEAIIRIKKYWK